MSADVVGWALIVLVFALVFLNVLFIGRLLGTPRSQPTGISGSYPPLPVPLPPPPAPPPPPPNTPWPPQNMW